MSIIGDLPDQPLNPPYIDLDPDEEYAREQAHEQNIEDAIDEYRWRKQEKQLDEILKKRAEKQRSTK